MCKRSIQVSLLSCLLVSAASAECLVPDNVRVDTNKDTALLAEYTWEISPLEEKNYRTEDAKELDTFKGWVNSFSPTDMRTLLQKQSRLFHLPTGNSFDFFMAQYLRKNVKTIGCLDGFLFSIHNRKFPNQRQGEGDPLHGTEFEAIIMKKPSGASTKIHVIFMSESQLEQSGVGPSAFQESKEFLKRTLSQKIAQAGPTLFTSTTIPLPHATRQAT